MKMASQRFCLRWNNHQSNLLSVFDQLLHAETFTDVTLAVEGQYLKAHKMVLSACSPYFNALFVNHPEKHPIVILKDVPYSDMKSLLDFMYRGEVSVDQERLTAFLRVAESLRIKGLTEVNDDKPTSAESAPAPPQLQRIQPYLVPQQRKQPNVLAANAAAAALHAAAQPSLLSSALMPKRKRGRPRKLSGSSNGTGNDYDEFEREGVLNDSDMGNGKLGNESYSGNDDASDDNQQESGNNDDLNESRDSLPSKRSKSGKDQRMVQQDDNSTSAAQATPELSQRLFGPPTLIPITTTTATEAISIREATTENATPTSLHLPTILGLKIRAINPSNSAAATKTATVPQKQQNNNSLLKQQLRGAAKDPDTCSLPVTVPLPLPVPVEECVKETPQQQQQQQQKENSCSALQSLANAAERQSQQAHNNNNNSSNNNASLHQQLLLHIAANAKHNASDYFQQQQQQQQQQEQQQQQQQQQTATAIHFKLIISINHRRSEPNQGLKSKSVAKQSTPTPKTTTTTIYCCIQILYKLEEILQFIIITHTISEDICASMDTCILLPAARRGDVEKEEEAASGHFGHLESFPYAYSKSVAIIFIIIIYYNYLNLYRHRKSLRRKHSGTKPDQNQYATGVCC
ncbi:protein tramtrack, alpha isoform isoform X4 [Drosophila innubila]|uniref:protein tramtrack, alpha isoform isoform X4 n=1 Tax=Drosophila innubila TaxID=198719 RepID=UPI00148BA864|nr:protein tramtrack, alpha isoform isoform X4 [Drosophila innubila]